MNGCAPWSIELAGSEIARIEQHGADLVVVLAAARVGGDRRLLDPARSGGHLLGVRWHLFEASWEGLPSSLIGRIDEAEWRSESGSHMAMGMATGMNLQAPLHGDSPTALTLKTALGDALRVRAKAWRVELPAEVRFAPSLAC
jgi:hypothetical protein